MVTSIFKKVNRGSSGLELLKVGEWKLICTTEPASQTDLDGEQVNNGRVGAAMKNRLVKDKRQMLIEKQNPGY